MKRIWCWFGFHKWESRFDAGWRLYYKECRNCDALITWDDERCGYQWIIPDKKLGRIKK